MFIFVVVVGFQGLENIAATSSTSQEIVLSESDGDVDSDDESSTDPDSDGHWVHVVLVILFTLYIRETDCLKLPEKIQKAYWNT